MVVFYSWKEATVLLLLAVVVTSYGFRHSPLLDDMELDHFLDDRTGLVLKRDPVKSNMWFGPRLGRRKRSTGENNLSVHDKADGSLIKFLQESPWAFIALKGGKRRTLNFTPRLGRDSDEEFGDNTLDSNFGRSPSSTGTQGRTYVGGNNFTPRLGRFAAAADEPLL